MSSYRDLLKYPNYSRLYAAGLSSELGSFITDSALMLFVFHITDNDNSFMGIIRAVFLICLTLGGIAGGVIGERFNRKKVLIFCEVMRIPLVCLLLLTKNPWAIVMINGSIAFFTGIFKPSRQAMVNDLVPPQDIKSANSLFGTTFATIHMIGPFIGASMYTWLKGINEIVVLDLVTYFVGIILLQKIFYKPPSSQTQQAPSKGFASEVLEGFRFSWNKAELRCLLTNTFILGASIGILIPLLLPFIKNIMGKSDFHYGLSMVAFGVGGVIGGALTNYLSRFFSSGRITLGCVFIEALLYLIWIRVHNFELNSAILFIWGVIVFVRITAQLNYLSNSVETKYLTRIHAILDLAFIVPNIGAGVIIGFIGNTVPTLTILHYSSLAFIIVIIIRAFLPETRSLWNDKEEQVFRDPNSMDG